MAGLQPVQSLDGPGSLAGRQQGRGPEVKGLVAQRVHRVHRAVERVERRERGVGPALAVREGGPGVDVDRRGRRVVFGRGLGVQHLGQRHAQGDGVVGGVGGRVLVQGLGARERREHEPLVEVDERELVPGLLGERAHADRLVDGGEPLARRVQVAATDGHVAQLQPRLAGDGPVAAGGGLLEPGLGAVEVAVDLAEQVGQRQGGGRGRVRVSVQDGRVAGTRGVGLGRRAEVGALPSVAGGLVVEPGAEQPGGRRRRAVGVALQDLVERPGRGLGRPGPLGLDGERQQRLAPLALQPVERADGVERRVVVAALQGQPRLELAQAPVERAERRGPLDRRGEGLGGVLAREQARELGLDGGPVLGRDGQELEVEVDGLGVVQGQAGQARPLQQELPVATEPLAAGVEHGGGLGVEAEPGHLVGDDPVGHLGVRGGGDGLGPGGLGVVGAPGQVERGAPLGEQVGRAPLARDAVVDVRHHRLELAAGDVGLLELEPDRQRRPDAVEVLQDGRRLLDAAVGEQGRRQQVGVLDGPDRVRAGLVDQPGRRALDADPQAVEQDPVGLRGCRRLGRRRGGQGNEQGERSDHGGGGGGPR